MYAGMMLMDPACEHESVHGAGHPHISKDDVHRLAGGEDRERLGRIRCFDYYIASGPQTVGHRQTDQDLIFNDQNRPSAGRYAFLRQVLKPWYQTSQHGNAFQDRIRAPFKV